MARVDPAYALVMATLNIEQATNVSADKKLKESKELYNTANKCTELYQAIMSESSDKTLDFSKDQKMKDLMDALRQKGVLKIEGYKISPKEKSTVTSGLLTQSNAFKSQANAITQFVPGMLTKLEQITRTSYSILHTEERIKDKILSRMVPGAR
jgi:hypothetical protein